LINQPTRSRRRAEPSQTRSKPAGQRGFAVIPRRWAVERTLAWITAHRRLARDYERDPAVSEAMIRWAAINTMTRRLARGGTASRPQRRVFETIT
jgi:transposase